MNAKLKQFLAFVFAFLWAFHVQAQQPVTGKVVDQNDEPISGVNINVKGTSNGTYTREDGSFEITNVPDGSTLVFSHLGYYTQEHLVESRSDIRIQLSEDPNTLDEVVVIGYGTQKRSDLTGAISSINEKSISESGVVNIDQVLQGRVAGVQFQQNSGMPGASNSVRIRGISSLSASTEPIYVIDGVIIEGGAAGGDNTNTNALASINPMDIVSVDVLKDASATAIYGSRASNGVIVITTRRGKAGFSTLSYHGYTGMQQIPKKMDVLNLRQYAAHRNTLADYNISTPNNNFIRPDLLGEGTDWQSELFNNAQMNNHNVSISGGSERNTYALTGGLLKQDGIAAGSGFKRLTLTGNFESQVKSYLKAGINFAFNHLNQTLTVSDQSLVSIALRTTPDVPVRNADGSFAASDEQFMPTNPMAMATLIDNRMESYGIRGNTFASADILSGLTFRTEVSFDYSTPNSYRFQPTYYLSPTQFMDNNEGTYSKQFNQFWTWRNILTYTKAFGVHSIDAMLGQEMQKTSWEFLGGSRTGYTTNGSTDLSLGDATTAANTGYSGASSILSEFGRVFYSYDDRYLLTATLRRDRSSKFAPENRTGWFPSAAFAWKVSSEGFLRDHPTINNLKLRLGWGLVGNQNIPDNYAYIATYGTATTIWGTGLIAANTPNEDLKWESTTSSNLGIDLGLWQDRVNFTVDFYHKKTENLLLQASLPVYAGTAGTGASGRPWVNLGSLQNRGIEFTLATTNFQRDNFRWHTNLVFSLNRNKVLAINTQTGIDSRTIESSTYGVNDSPVINQTIVGQPIGQFYGYQIVGRFEQATDFYYKDEAGDIHRIPVMFDLPIDEQTGVWVGDYIYRDVNFDGIIDEQDRAFIGNPAPDFTFGVGNTFNYRNWDLTVFLTGSYGNDVINYSRRFLENPRRNISNLYAKALNYARLELIDPDGPNDYRNVRVAGGDGDMSRLAIGQQTSNYNYAFSDRYVEDGSYLRIQNITLAYNFPTRWMERIKLQNLKIYANLQNVYTFTNYSGYDPEIGITYSGGNQLNGVDNGRYPAPRIYTLGVNLSL
ncbi:SusC/RagA family TonB-linked outer membrane protein [Parapedobacter koreensis]|uniref:TonB-linked outer membrane protein, SusC/RagA family n=1 Tax=Parapedobacter koreensis TaxID=332977 RepID=A0A1H7JRP6_9SPHI|nr:TonB-dependent receptor [Parapedobacter koreensis]SEK77368.1 TonB-linked outer membrane protein, SusC/RagA family [Parapedobacter koreensis]